MSSRLLGTGRAPSRAFGGGTASAVFTTRRQPLPPAPRARTTDIEEVLRRAEGTQGAQLDGALVPHAAEEFPLDESPITRRP